VLDVGKTSVKLAVTDGEGRVVEARSRPNRVIGGLPYPHFDAEGSWSWMLATLGELGTRHRIGCIVPVAHGACAALVDEHALVLPMLDYEHDLSDVETEYESLARDFERTGSPKLPGGLNLGRQLFWLERHHKESFGRVRHVLTHPQYWAFRLSGVASAEVTSLGCHTDLWEPGERRFSAFAEARGYSRRFPEIVPAWHRLGPLSADVVQRTGLSEQCQVLAGVHDSNASYFAHRAAARDPFTVVSTGTWTIIMAGGRPIDGLDPDRDMLANVDAFGEPVACCRFMGGREYQALAGDAGLAVIADVDALARIVDAGVMAHPQFADQGGPFRGAVGYVSPTGSAERTTPVDAAALATLYTALLTDYCLDLLGASGDIVIDGRMTGNVAWLDTLASLRGAQRVLASGDAEGSVRGAVALASWPHCLTTSPLRPCSPLPLGGLEAYRAAWRAALPEGGKSASSSR